MGFLIKFGYDGSYFTGFQSGNGENSVEDSIMKTLRSIGIKEKIRSAARTDRGVSSSGNVFMIQAEIDPKKILKILNAKCRNMVFYSYAHVENGFNPRHCKSKSYTYFIPGNWLFLRQAFLKFEGEHDFSCFCRRDSRSSYRRIEKISLIYRHGYTEVKFTAQSFVWEQIRSIVGYCMANRDRVNQTDPFSEKIGRRIVASPQPLILNDIQYRGIKFIYEAVGKSVTYLRGISIDLRTRSMILDRMTRIAKIIEH
ncbi:MAG: hypothetical protein AAE987_06545 [Thermoplasmataceae archaeon]|jgi:tRNA pseudouridine38-40 synthase